MIRYLYAVTTKVGECGEIKVCEPIFIREFKKNQKKFYRRENGAFKEISIKKYGEPNTLPIKDISEDKTKEYFILFEPHLNKTKVGNGLYSLPIRTKEENEYFWIPSEMTVGIKFPDAFVWVPKDGATVEELEKNI